MFERCQVDSNIQGKEINRLSIVDEIIKWRLIA